MTNDTINMMQTTSEPFKSSEAAKTKIRFAFALAMSGCAALIYQVAWQRVMTQIIGSDAVSMVLVVTIFMICLGVGSEIASLLVARSQAQALKLYAIVEVLVAFYGVASIPMLRWVNSSAGLLITDSLTIDLILNLGLLSLPIIGMGLTTPLIVHVAKEQLSNIGRTVGILYGWNIAGAAFGSLLAGLVLIELVGLLGATYFAAIMNILAATVAILGLRLLQDKTQLPSIDKSIHPKPTTISRRVILAAMLFGFGTLAIQIIFFRVLSNYLTLSTIVFPLLLCAYLCLMSIGQWIGGVCADRFSQRLPHVIAILFTLGASLLLAALKLPPEWAAPLQALRFSTFNGQLLSPEYTHLIGDPSPIIAFLFCAGMMTSVIAWSALFPVMFRFVTKRINDAGNKFARIYTIYTLGNVLGSFTCGIYLLPYLGTGSSASVTIVLVGIGAAFIISSELKILRKSAYSILALGILSAILIPKDYYRSFKFGKYEVAEVFEGRTGVATVVPTSRFYTIIDVNRTASASALNTDPAPSDLYQAWRWNHTDLMALDPSFRPKNILIIGIGHAYLIDSMLDLPFVEKITVVDLSGEVVEAVKKYTKTSSKRIFTDSKVQIIIADGRRYVQSAIKRGERFDLIQNKINEPWHAGGSNLFTEEFFLQQKKLLTSNGYLSTRPLTGHLTDGFKVFGNATWAGYYHLYFKNGVVNRPTTAIITPDIRNAWITEVAGKANESSSAQREYLDVSFFDTVPNVLRTIPNTDDHPTFEYYWLRKSFNKWISPQINFMDSNMKQYTEKIMIKYN